MRKILLYILIICGFYIISCQKDKNNSKVATEEGYITVINGDSINLYKIEEISYKLSNDTTSLEISALKSNSDKEYLVIGMRNIIDLKEKKYEISNLFETLPDSSSSYLYYYNSTSENNTIIKQGELNVLKYNPNNIFQATFSYDIQNPDSVTVKGEINLNFATFDPTRIPNVPLSPARLRVELDSTQINMSCITSYLINENKYILNGVKDNSTLVIEIEMDKIIFSKIYSIGINIDSTQYIKLTYTDETGSYICDGNNNTQGTITIVKISYNTFQGYFEASAYNDKNKKRISFQNGIFFSRLKRI